jgi:valyl-tRNA synthetase
LFIKQVRELELLYNTIRSIRLNDLGKFDASIVKEHFAESIAMRKEQTENTLDTFTIVLPPPNVTGNLHVGHALTCTIEDTICRYQRLLGKKVYIMMDE